MVKLTHSVCSGRNGMPADDVEDAGAEEGHDHPGQHAHLEADVLDEVVVEPAPELDRLDDRREVVVGEDHRRGLLRDLGAGDAHGDADVGLLERRRVVDAVAGHAHDVPLALEDVDEPHLLLGRHAGDDADLVDLAVGLLVAELGELRAGDGAALDAELARDRRGGDRVVAGDHPHLDAGRVRRGDRGLRGRRAAGRRCRPAPAASGPASAPACRRPRRTSRGRSPCGRSPSRAGPARRAARSRRGSAP